MVFYGRSELFCGLTYVDDAVWPQDLTLELFKAWCDVEIHGMVFDIVDEPLVDDELDLSARLIRQDG